MNLDQSFEVKAPIDDVWKTLIDVQRIAPCLPGAEISDADEEGTYHGTFQVRLGPTTAAYRGTLKMQSLDEAGYVATMAANGQDKRGQGSAKATIVSTLSEVEGGTKVDVNTDFSITGRLARFGRGGMIQDISNRLLRDFASCLQQTIESSGTPTAEPVGEGAGAQGRPETAGEGVGAQAAAAGQGAATGPAPVGGTSSPPASTPAGGGAAAPSGGAETASGGAGGSAPSVPPPPRPTPVQPRPAPQQAKPVQGFSLFFSALWERIKRMVAERRSK